MANSALKEAFNREAKIEYIPNIPLRELSAPAGHKVYTFRKLDTKFGASVLAVAEKDGVLYETFLPKRFTEVFTPEVIEQYNKHPTYRLRYCGAGRYGESVVELM